MTPVNDLRMKEFQQAVADLLESGSDEGCENCLVVASVQYYRVQALLHEWTGIRWGVYADEQAGDEQDSVQP